MLAHIRSPRTKYRSTLNISLDVLVKYISVLQGYCFKLSRSVQRNDNASIAQRIDEILQVCERTTSLIKEVVDKVILDALERAGFEDLLVDNIKRLLKSERDILLRRYLVHGLGSSYTLVLVDFLGLIAFSPELSDKFTDVLVLGNTPNQTKLSETISLLEDETRLLMKKPESGDELMSELDQEKHRFRLDLTLAIRAYASLLYLVFEVENTGKKVPELENTSRHCARALNNLILKYIQSPSVKVEVIEEVRKFLVIESSYESR